MAFTDEGSSQIDVEQFLKEAKITQKADIFKTKQISIEELIELTRQDLESFAKDLGLDALERNRFIKAISKHKQKQQQVSPISTTTTSSVPTRKSHVIVSSAEHNGITKLYERYDKSSALSQSIQSAVLTLNNSESDIITQIENFFQTLSTNIQNKKQYLLNDIDVMIERKKQLLTQQLSALNNYIPVVEQGKVKYNQYISDSTIIINKRKQMVLTMINDIMNYNGISMVMLTAPKMEFNIAENENQLDKLCENALELNDCDQPHTLALILQKATFSTIIVQFKLHDSDIKSSKKILEISLEYAILPKSFVIKSPVKKKKKVKIKKKRKTSHDSVSDTRSDSSESRSESESKSASVSDEDTSQSDVDVKLSNVDEIDLDSVKWKTVTDKIKFSKKHSKRNKYGVEDLKSNRGYVIRMRARNDSGWGEYSEIIVTATKKGFMDCWNRDKKGANISIKRNCIKATNNSWSTVYGKTVCKKGYKYQWRMRITVPNASSYHMMIGIVDTTRDITSTHCQTNGCWIFNPYGSGSNIYEDGRSGKNYGVPVKTGDIVEQALDLKKYTLSFRVNNIDYGVAMKVPKNRKYHLAISTSNIGTMVELLKPK